MVIKCASLLAIFIYLLHLSFSVLAAKALVLLLSAELGGCAEIFIAFSGDK